MAFHPTFHGTSPRKDCETNSAVTFHRAFDVTPDWRRSLEAIANLKGITRILTRRVTRARFPL
jgi:copper homeostasis protein CutC